MEPTKNHCLVCKQTSNEIPLLTFEFQEQPYHVCPQHLPLMIHKPEQLAEYLPGIQKEA